MEALSIGFLSTPKRLPYPVFWTTVGWLLTDWIAKNQFQVTGHYQNMERVLLESTFCSVRQSDFLSIALIEIAQKCGQKQTFQDALLLDGH